MMKCLKSYSRQSEHYNKGQEYNMNPATADENEAYFGEKLWSRGSKGKGKAKAKTKAKTEAKTEKAEKTEAAKAPAKKSTKKANK